MVDRVGHTALADKERPLVTFTLLSYNQEKYVREAVEAAFAQTYEPLEIILSDDCSSDQTFNILQEMAAQYHGPHRVVVQSTGKNMGPFAHVMDVSKKARGELIILAAADDISKPERTDALVKAWQMTGAWGLHSKYDRINENGIVQGVGEQAQSLLLPDCRLRMYFYQDDGEVDIVHGTTSAYDRRLFSYVDNDSCEFILSEDGVFSLLLNLLKKKVSTLDESLVLYRSHSGSLTNAPTLVRKMTVHDIKENIHKSATYAASCEERARFLLKFSDSTSESDLRRINREEVERDIRTFRIQSEWVRMTFSERLTSVLFGRSAEEAIWMLPRALGLRFFIAVKYLTRNFQYCISRLGQHLRGI